MIGGSSPEDNDIQHFPDGCVDDHGDPLDLRLNTSWSFHVGEVTAHLYGNANNINDPTSSTFQISLSETVEVQLINCIVPFTIINTLWPHLTNRTINCTEPRFVINVSSPEGQFSASYKPSVHPHTNMAKASKTHEQISHKLVV